MYAQKCSEICSVVDNTDLNQPLDMVREFLTALSAECISQLLEIFKDKQENTDRKNGAT